MTSEFLDYSKSVGNDLSTPIPKFNFRASIMETIGVYVRKGETSTSIIKHQNFLKSTNIITLSVINIEILKRFDINYQGGN